jgi:hypothetical protein
MIENPRAFLCLCLCLHLRLCLTGKKLQIRADVILRLLQALDQAQHADAGAVLPEDRMVVQITFALFIVIVSPRAFKAACGFVAAASFAMMTACGADGLWAGVVVVVLVFFFFGEDVGWDVGPASLAAWVGL